MASMRELSEQIVNQTLTNKAAENYRMTPYGAIARPSEIVEDEDSIFRKPLETEGRFNILPLRDMPNGEREFALPLPRRVGECLYRSRQSFDLSLTLM